MLPSYNMLFNFNHFLLEHIAIQNSDINSFIGYDFTGIRSFEYYDNPTLKKTEHISNYRTAKGWHWNPDSKPGRSSTAHRSATQLTELLWAIRLIQW